MSNEALSDTHRIEVAPPSPGQPGMPFLDNRVIGYSFLVFIGVLGACVVFAFVYFIVVSLESPSFLPEYVKQRSEIPAQLTVTLEYESRTLKTMGVQIAFGFLVGLVFSAIGVLLFAAGANGAMQLESNAAWLPVTVSATAPGLAVLLLGGLIIALAVSKDVSRDLSAEMRLPSGSASSESKKRVISTPPVVPNSASPRTEPD